MTAPAQGPADRTFRFRGVRPGDADALAALYAGLSADDRYRRFFSAYRPDRAFFEAMASPDEHGGARLVALVATGDDREELVGEAGYAPMPNGDGELAITVARRWRGWLGPYLLAALLDVAAERGVPNLEADVLAVNGPMLAVARRRDCVVLESPDWETVRVVLGTRGSATWPGPHDRRRVLVEGAGGGAGPTADARTQTIRCPGPASRHRGCPALRGEPCPLARDADLVVVRRPAALAGGLALLDAHARVHPGVPVRVEDPVPAGSGAPAVGRTVR